MNIILHITKIEQWENAQELGSYTIETLESEGFIHCCKIDQLIDVANTFFPGQTELILLCINRDKVKAKIRDENCEGGSELFPHIYGPLNLDAIFKVISFHSERNGSYILPQELTNLLNTI